MPEMDVRSSGPGVTGCYELPCRFWDEPRASELLQLNHLSRADLLLPNGHLETAAAGPQTSQESAAHF